MGWVRNGTVSVTNGSASVTGASTTFQASGVLPGQAFIGPDGRHYEVLTVTSNTALTLASSYIGTTAAGQTYQIDTGPDALGQTVYQRVLELLNWIAGTIPAVGALLNTPSSGAATGSVLAARGTQAVFEGTGGFLARLSRATQASALWLQFDDALSGRWRIGAKAAGGNLFLQRSSDGATFTDVWEANATTGAMTFANLNLNPNLDGLSDVAVSSPATGHVLRHDGTQFVNVLGTTHFAAASHTHDIANVTGLQAELDGKAGTASPTLTGVLTIPAGTAAAPSLTAAGDTDTGLCFPLADAVGVCAGGAVRTQFTVDSINLVDVGGSGSNRNNIDLTVGSGASPVSYLQINHRTTVTTGNWYCGFLRNGTTIGSITQSGTTGVAYNTSSDYRLKENVTPLANALDRLALLQPRRFNFKAEPGITVDGFIAHEVAPIVPQAVTGAKDATDADGKPMYQGMDAAKLVPLLTAAVQELAARVEALEAR